VERWATCPVVVDTLIIPHLSNKVKKYLIFKGIERNIEGKIWKKDIKH